jgi:type IV pilus assembly protein PilM
VPKTVVGLDIGTSSVRGVEIRVGKTRPVLVRIAQEEMAPGSTREGEIANPPAVGDAISRLWKSGKFKGKDSVVVGVANSKVIVRQVELQWMPEEELRNALAFQVQEFIPIPVEEAIIDYLPVEDLMTPDGQRLMRILVVAAQKEMVQNLVETLKYAKIQPAVIDLSALALMRSLVSLYGLEEPIPAEAIVDIGAGITNVVVHEQARPRFVRIIAGGGDDFTIALSEQLGVDPMTAEQIKREISASGSPPPGYERAIDVLEEKTAAFVDEIRGSLDYYMAQPEAQPVGRVLLSGGGSQLRNIADQLQSAVGVPVDRGHPLQYVELADLGMHPEQLASIEPYLAVPVGLALSEAV